MCLFYVWYSFICFKSFCNYSQIMIDPIPDTSGIKTTRKQVGAVSKRHWYVIFADGAKVIDVNQKKL